MPARRKPSSDAPPAEKKTALAKSSVAVTEMNPVLVTDLRQIILNAREQVARQMNAALFERSLLNPPKLSTVLRELHPQAAEFFKDVYSLEFLGLPADHSEADLHGALLRNLGRFITELGRDFCFIGSEHPIQVGVQDFALDLLFSIAERTVSSRHFLCCARSNTRQHPRGSCLLMCFEVPATQ